MLNQKIFRMLEVCPSNTRSGKTQEKRRRLKSVLRATELPIDQFHTGAVRSKALNIHAHDPDLVQGRR